MSRWSFLFVAIALVGCSASESEEGEKASDAICPTDSQLTYDNFGSEFFSKYCTDCHSSSLSGEARHDAPIAYNFDTVEGIREFAEHIDVEAAAGPIRVNEKMPPKTADAWPTEAERKQLGEWLACGAP